MLTDDMSLLTLPTELLFQIAETISRITPNDIESIGRTSSQLRDVSAPLVKEHRKLLKEFTKLDVDIAGAAKALFEICKRPWVALYPRHLEVSANRSWRTLERPRNARQTALLGDVAMKRSLITDEDLGHLILKTGLISPQDACVWTSAISSGDEDYLFALLLACLSNVQRVVIRPDSNKMEQVKEMVRAIKVHWPQRQTLPELRIVHVVEREGSRSCDLEMFPLFAAIPGVEKMHGSVRTAIY